MNAHKKPKISIVMPVYNGEKYLAKAIECFLSQDYPEKELIIVDGKSTDRSHEIIRHYCKEHPFLIWLNYPDKGLADAVNHGVKQCSGDLIGYLGADDLLYPDIFKTIAQYDGLINFDAVYFNSYTYFILQNKCSIQRCSDKEFTHENLLAYGTLVGLQNIFFKRHIYDRYSFNPLNQWSLDYELYLELTFKENYLYLYVDQIATINLMDGNISTIRAKEQAEEAIEVAKKYGKVVKRELTSNFIAVRVMKKIIRLARHFTKFIRNV